MIPRLKFLLLFSAAIFLGNFTESSFSQQTNFSNPKGVSGYKVEIQHEWPTSPAGIKYLKVKITSTAPVPERRQFNVVALIGDENRNRNDNMRVVKPVVFEAGDTVVEAELHVPVVQMINANSIRFFIDSDGNYQFNRGDMCRQTFHTTYSSAGERYTNLLVISSSVKTEPHSEIVCNLRGRYMVMQPTSRQIRGPMPNIEEIVTDRGTTPNLNETLSFSEFYATSVENVPSTWVGLTGFDTIVISLADLKQLTRNHPDGREALNGWTLAGGSLLVTDAGQKFEQATVIRGLLSGQARIGVTEDRPWMTPKSATKKWLQVYKLENNGYYQDVVTPSNGSLKDSIYIGKSRVRNGSGARKIGLGSIADEESPAFVYCQHGVGRICLSKDAMQKAEAELWRDIHNAFIFDGRLLSERIYLGEADDVVDSAFNIPTVGLPPVTMFLFLITLFLFLAGPVTFFLLKRVKKMQLLFVIVPSVSTAACLGLVAYAIVADGFSTRGRMESFSRIDHSENNVMTYSRHAMYAGVEPTGYKFSNDSIVSPWSDSTLESRLVDREGQLTVSGGNIQARVPHQMVSVHQTSSTARMLVQPKDENSSEIFNRLGVPVQAAIYLDFDGKLKAVETILADGESAVGEDIAIADAMVLIRDWNQEKNGDQATRFETDANPYNYYYNSSQSKTSQGGDYEFQNDQMLRQLKNYLGKPGNYIALTDNKPDFVQIPTDGIIYKSQAHIIFGVR